MPTASSLAARRSLRVGIAAYLLLLLVPPLLQWRGVLPLGWGTATAFLWGPWLLLFVFSALTFVVRLVGGGRRV